MPGGARPDVEVANGIPWQDISIQDSTVITISGGFRTSGRCPMSVCSSPLDLRDPNTPAIFCRVAKRSAWFQNLVMGKTIQPPQLLQIKVLDIIRYILRASFSTDTARV